MGKKDKISSIDFEIVNVKPINKYISECEIKVFYHGKNRNGSYISKAVGNQIANSLPRAPIVALYNEEIDDYRDHGEQITINREGVKFEKKTIPYGAVDKDTPAIWKKVWDDKGNEQEYLVVRGFLWTGRYPHLQKILVKPKGQSMEFFEESVVGNWAKFDNEDDELFIFNEADISALCILGDDVEPCFEDSTIGRPEITYSLEKNEFKKEFDTFMFELNEALEHDNSTEGGMAMEKNENVIEFSASAIKAIEKAEKTKTAEDIKLAKEAVNALEDGDEKEALLERVNKIEAIEDKDGDFELEEKDITKKIQEAKENAPDAVDVNKPESEDNIGDGEEAKKELIEQRENEDLDSEDTVDSHKEDEVNEEFEQLKTDYSLVKKELEDLKVEFELLQEEKSARELVEKEAVCNKFSILGEETLNSFKENLTNYTAEELEKELSVIAFQKGVSFSLLSQKDAIVTPSPSKETKNVPAWVKAVATQESESY